jgi:hypothetical protein
MKCSWLALAGVVLVAGTACGGQELQARPADATGSSFLIHEVTDSLLPSGVYNVVTYASPRAVKVAELGLREAGLTQGRVPKEADEIRIFSSREKMQESPKARLWLNAREHGQLWYQTGGTGPAEGHVLEAGEVLVVYTRAAVTPIAWANPLR